MKKFTLALALFEQKQPGVEVVSITRSLKNWFMVETKYAGSFSVDLSGNKVEHSYPDPEY